MKHLFLGLVLLFSFNAFTQGLSERQKAKIKRDMAKLTEVMLLTGEQTPKMYNVREEMTLNEAKITNSHEKSTTEIGAEWYKHMNCYNAKMKALVTQKQWDAWIAYYYYDETFINQHVSEKVEEDLAAMTEIMKLSDKQISKMLKLRTDQARDEVRILETILPETPEIDAAWKAHKEEYSAKTTAAVSDEQWYSWITHTGNDLYLDEDLKKELKKEMSEMKEVMGLSDKQVQKMYKIKTVQAFEAMNIISTYKQGTVEMVAAWEEYGNKFRTKAKSAVSKDQWNLWLGYTCAACNKRRYSEEDKEALRKKELTTQLRKAEETIAEMVEVMSLYPEQEQAIRKIKLKLAKDIVQVYDSTDEGPERYAQINTLTRISNTAMLEATSHEQMDSWWYYWEMQQQK